MTDNVWDCRNSDVLWGQRREFAGSLYDLNEIRRSANYYAPDRHYMYSAEDGTQDRLYHQRYDDGIWWTAFKKRTNRALNAAISESCYCHRIVR